MAMRGHTFTWHQQTSPWAFEEIQRNPIRTIKIS